MKKEQALTKLDPIYHEEFNELYRSHLGIDEELLGTSSCTWITYPGYFVVTSKRCVLVYYNWRGSLPLSFGERPRVYYTKNKGQSGRATTNHYWLLPPNKPLTKSEIDHRTILGVSYSDLERVEAKRHLFKHGGKELDLIDLSLFAQHDHPLLQHVAFQADSGEEIYTQVLKCLRGEVVHGGDLRDDNLTKELERLSRLFQDGLLTSEQFEAAKDKLLQK